MEGVGLGFGLLARVLQLLSDLAKASLLTERAVTSSRAPGPVLCSLCLAPFPFYMELSELWVPRSSTPGLAVGANAKPP